MNLDKPTTEGQVLVGVRILCVDDSQEILLISKAHFERAGAQVELAHSVEQALEKLQIKNFEVVLTDIEMPDRDGFSLLEDIRRSPKSDDRNLPIIALTAYDHGPSLQKIRDAGFQGVLKKSEIRHGACKIAEVLSQNL